jgi:arylsulfatase A-like enzyme
VSWIDLLPTLVDLAGGEPPAEMDGRSFAAVLRGDKTAHREAIFATHSGDREFNVYPMRSLRDGRWKYIRNLHPEFQFATHINRGGERDGRDYFSTWEQASRTNPQAAAIVKRYKERPAEEMYDLKADPHEQHNLAASAEHAQRLAAMRNRLTAWMREQGDQETVFNRPLLLGEPATPLTTPAGKAKTGK